jgi:hypothetical protein
MGKQVDVGNVETSGGQRVFFDVITELHRVIAFQLSEDFPINLEDIDQLVAAVDMLATLVEDRGIGILVDNTTIQRWRDACLGNFDREVEYQPGAEKYGEERRKVIRDVFLHLGSANTRPKRGH